MSLSELLERVNAASADYRIGYDVTVALLGREAAHAFLYHGARGHINPATSIDAAVALIERVLPGWRWMVRRIYPEDGGGPLFCAYAEQVDGPMFSRTAPTPPLALIAALLEAKIAEDKP